jgi:ureidoacrylate peracid hydrolase
MSTVSIPPHAVERVLHKRGRLSVYEAFEPARTALIMVDMQHYYLDRIPRMRQIVPTAQSLAETLRSRGCLIVWLLNTLERDGVDLWPTYHERFFSKEAAQSHRSGLASGLPSHALASGLTPAGNDVILEKTRFSAFAPSSSELDRVLADHQIENIIISGVATNVCCESTARDAMMRDFRVVCVDDAMAAVTDEDHRCGLATLYSCFADVRRSEEVTGQLVLA